MDIAKLGKQKAQQAVDFITSLKHVKDPFHGCYFELLYWQEKIIRDVYGTLKPDGTRQYKHVYIEIPKKQGKSEMLAAVALKQLCADGEWFGEVYGCAADKGQASIIFDVAVAMIEQEPELSSRCYISNSKKRIFYRPTNSFYQVLSAEAYTKHGLNVSTVLFDELHAQPNRGLYDVMTFGSGDARRQPMFWYITTAGDDPDRKSIGWEMHKKAESVLFGMRDDPTFYPVIYGIDPEERRVWKGWTSEIWDKVDWRDPHVWQAVNPSAGHTVQVSTMREAYVNVKDNPVEERNFRWLRLNEWIKYKHSKWLGLDVWDGSSSGPVIPEALKGQKCYGGLDLSSKSDITAYVLLFPPTAERKKWHVLPTFWIPEDSMKDRVAKDKVPYDQWVAQGFMKKTPGNVVDYDFIRKTISGESDGEPHAHCLRDDYEIEESGFDPWNAHQIAQDLYDDGLTMVEVRQGFKTMSPAMKEIEKLLKGKELEHGGNPVLRWMFGNLEVKRDENENIRPVKDKSTDRIDGFVALVNAMARAMLHEQNKQDPGVIFL